MRGLQGLLAQRGPAMNSSYRDITTHITYCYYNSTVGYELERSVAGLETETLDIDLGLVTTDDELGLDLAGGRDDPVCPGETPIYIACLLNTSEAADE